MAADAATHQHSAHDTDHDMQTAGSVCTDTACAAQVACAWICSGMVSGVTGTEVGPAMVLKSRGPGLPQDIRREGIAPEQNDRPPILS